MSTPGYRINHQIQAKELRVLRDDGTQIGVLTRENALSQAHEAGVDLVEIAPQAVPPVAKLIDYKKLMYQLAKKEQAAKSAAKKVDLKEVRLTPFMAQNDFDHRLRQGREFLEEGHKLRINVKFVGRQLTHREFGPQTIARVTESLKDVATIEQAGKWMGKFYIATFTPLKIKHVQAKDQKISEQEVQSNPNGQSPA
ncbi:MAG: translation initiation factor IF-3 [bacterium]|nr:translation initiation factor IF-3 [bacterium]